MVVQFSPRPGFPDGWFIAGYNLDGNEVVYFLDVYADAEEAARAADSHAESIAEAEMEYSTRQNEARRLNDETEEKKQRIAELFALRNNPRFPDSREELREVIEEVREMLDRLKNDFSDVGI